MIDKLFTIHLKGNKLKCNVRLVESKRFPGFFKVKDKNKEFLFYVPKEAIRAIFPADKLRTDEDCAAGGIF